MVGLGETHDEMVDAFGQLREQGVQVLTVGQYLRPTERHLPVVRYWHPDEFKALEAAAYALGFDHIAAGPLVRSSYHADEHVTQETGRARGPLRRRPCRALSLGRQPVAVRVGDGLGAVAHAGLGEHAVDVALDRRLADHEPLGDLRFESPSAISVSTSASRGVSPSGSAGASAASATRGDDVVLHRGVERRLAARDGLDRVVDLVRARVLGQVAARAGAQRAEHGRLVGVRRERDHARRGRPSASRRVASMPSSAACAGP